MQLLVKILPKNLTYIHAKLLNKRSCFLAAATYRLSFKNNTDAVLTETSTD